MNAMTPTWTIGTEEQAYISSALQAVSRSFALVIPMLEAPLDSSVGVAYLLCRVADNIEDCTELFSWKQERFVEFKRILHAPHTASTVLKEWSAHPWPGLTDDERDLMGREGGLLLWQLLASMPASHRSTIARWAEEMAVGMERFLAPAPNDLVAVHQNTRILRESETLDLYCYYVAGTVGHMCTELVVEHYHLDEAAIPILNHHCEAFGRALQKTNIFKDFWKDLQRGVSYLPVSWMQQVEGAPLFGEGAPRLWVREVIAHIWSELDLAVDYVLALPYEATGYRQFCLRAILPGYETLMWSLSMLDELFTSRHHIKISRARMMECLQWASDMDTNNARLLEYRDQRRRERDELLQLTPVLGATHHTFTHPSTRVSA